MLKLSDLIEQFLRYCELHRAPKTVTYYRYQFKRSLKALGDMPACDLAASHLLFLPTSWHLIQSLQRLTRWAHKEAKLIKKNPLKHVKKPRLGMRRRVMSRAEMVLAIRSSVTPFRDVLLALRETSARPQEIRAVLWEQVRWHAEDGDMLTALQLGAAWFELDEYKARDRRADPSETRVIPITPRIGRLLARLGRRTAHLAGHIFLNRFGKPWNKNTLVCAMRRLRVKTGLTLKPGAGKEQVCCYTFRHSAATQLAGEGLATHLLQSLLGHSQVSTTERYVHLSKEALLQAFQRHAGKKHPRDKPTPPQSS